MHIAFGRVRHKTSPTRGGENVCLFFWFTIDAAALATNMCPSQFLPR